MNVVAVMAHQDDEMRCLGTMLKCRARGDRLFFVTVTDGSGGFVQQPDISREEGARIRHEEMSALAAAAGAEFVNIRERDEYLYDTPAVRHAVIEALRRTGADLVFTHWHDDYNLDHTTTYSLVRHCAMHACLPMVATASKPLARHPAIFCVEPHGPIPFPGTHYVDITPFEDAKIELLKNHRSQETAMQMAVHAGFDRLCRRPDAYWGEKVGCEYAECFAQMPARGAVRPGPILP